MLPTSATNHQSGSDLLVPIGPPWGWPVLPAVVGSVLRRADGEVLPPPSPRAVIGSPRWKPPWCRSTSALPICIVAGGRGLEPYFDEGLQLGRADIPGFTNWREVCKGDPREVRRAEAVLERYGRLVDLPDHRILTPKQARGREADTVIVDRTSGIFSDGDLATAMSRARRKLIVVRKLK
jgi:hypothetical protein